MITNYLSKVSFQNWGTFITLKVAIASQLNLNGLISRVSNSWTMYQNLHFPDVAYLGGQRKLLFSG